MFQIFGVHNAFEGEKNIHVFYFLVGLLRKIWVPDCDLEFWNWFVFGYWSFMQICLKFWHTTMIMKLQRSSMVLFWLVYRGWWRFLTWKRNLDFDSDMVTSLWYTYVKIWAVWNCFEDAKNIHVFEVYRGCGWRWRFLTLVWNIDLDLYVFNGHGNTQVLTFGFYLDFLGCKEIYFL